MAEYINFLIDNYNIPALTAFLLGVLCALSPCPLAANLTAIAFISREVKDSKRTLLQGLVYTLGLAASYTLLATLIYLGASPEIGWSSDKSGR
jgi:cytochrome c biogenesis protein CcdA